MPVIAIIVLLILAVLFSMLCSAVLIGTTAAWFLHLPFMTGWHAAWDKPWVLLGYALLVGIAFGSSRTSRS